MGRQSIHGTRLQLLLQPGCDFLTPTLLSIFHLLLLQCRPSVGQGPRGQLRLPKLPGKPATAAALVLCKSTAGRCYARWPRLNCTPTRPLPSLLLQCVDDAKRQSDRACKGLSAGAACGTHEGWVSGGHALHPSHPFRPLLHLQLRSPQEGAWSNGPPRHAAACLLQVCVVVGDACPSLTNKWGQRGRDYPILTCQGA